MSAYDARFDVLSDAMRAFAEATSDPERLLQIIARRTAEVMGAYCGFGVVSEDKEWLNPVALFDPDPTGLDLIQQLAASAPLRIGAEHPLARSVMSGEAVLLPGVSPETLRARFERVEDQEKVLALDIKSVLFTPLRASGATIGALSLLRHGPGAAPFDTADVRLAQSLADHAALALANARLLSGAQRWQARLRVLTDLAKEFAAATSDYQLLLDLVTRRMGELIGDMCSIRFVAEDGQWIEPTGSLFHSDAALVEDVREFVLARPQRVGEGLSGKVAATGQPILMRGLEPGQPDPSIDPRYQAMADRLRITTIMCVPLWSRARVIGVASLIRSDPDRPYTEDDLQLFLDATAHATLAIKNARLFARNQTELVERNRLTDRLRVLSELSQEFAAATDDYRALLELVAWRLGQVIGEQCAIRILSEDGERFEVDGAFHHPDTESLAEARAMFIDRPQAIGEGIAGRVARDGQTMFVPVIDPVALAASLPERYSDFVTRQGYRSAIAVALRSRGKVIGVISIYRTDPLRPYTVDDQRLVEDVATHAALAIVNARLFAAGKVELAERQRLNERLHALSEAAREFAGTTASYVDLLERVARRIGEVIGDLCVVRMIAADGEWFESFGCVHHADPTVAAAAREAVLARPQRVGEGLVGRIAATGAPILIPASTVDDVAQQTQSVFRPFIERIGATGWLGVSLRSQGVVVGVVLLCRTRPDVPYGPDDLSLLEDLAAHASLAITNSRLLEASKQELAERMRTEEVLRRGFLEAAPDAVLIVNATGHIVLVNTQTETLFGYTRAELTGQRIEVLVPTRFRAQHPGHRTDYLGAASTRPMGVGLDLFALRKDGTEFAAEISLSPIETPDGKLVAAAIRDVTERRRDMEERNKRMQEANRLKSEFLANMSHELRTPLNAIIGFAALMHGGKVGAMADTHREYLGDILNSSRHLLQLINDVLDLAKVESGRTDVRAEKVDLAKLVQEVRDILRGLAAEKRVKLLVQLSPALPHVVVDPRSLKQILYNFLSNAIKFTPEAGQVSLRVGPADPDSFRIDVEDTGIGIKREDMSRLFIEFQQLDAGKAKKYPGTGLGLALTKRLVEAQGGTVEVVSTPGKGSTFSAILPRVVQSSLEGR